MNAEKIECSITGCRSVPHCDCRWGTDNLPVQAATFCKEHADELWHVVITGTGHIHHMDRDGFCNIPG